MREKKNTRRKKQNIKIHTLAARRASELRERERERVYTTNISRHIINIVKRHVLYRLIKTRVDLYFCVFHQFLMSRRYFKKRPQKLFLGSPRSVGSGRSISGRKKNHHHEQRSYSGKTDEFVRGRFRRRRARDVLVLVLYSREKIRHISRRKS